MSIRSFNLEHSLQSAHGMLKSVAETWESRPHETPASSRLFVTISRQAGIDAEPYVHQLAKALGDNWTAWDHSLIEKVAADHGISEHLLEAIENQRHTWLDDLFSSFSPVVSRDFPDEARIYKRIVIAARAMAVTGDTILVGKGTRFITFGMPGGRHVRLVAPLATRIATLARMLDLTAQAAAKRLVELDAAREDFYRRYWPGKSLAPTSFELTLNASELSVEQMVECTLPIVRAKPMVMGQVAVVGAAR